MAVQPIIQSRAISETRRIIQARDTGTNPWLELADFTANIADDLKRDEIAAKAQQRAERDTGIESQALQFREAHAADPKGFNTSWEKFSAEMLSQTPSAEHDELLVKLQKERNKNYGPILTQFQKSNRTRAADSLGARTERLESEVVALAGQGKAGSEEYNEAYSEIVGNIRTQANLGLRTPESAESDINRITRTAKVETIVGVAKADFDGGKFSNISMLHKDLIDGALLGDIAIEERRKVADRMIGDITLSMQLERAQEVQGNERAAKEIKQEQRLVHDELYSKIYKGELDSNWIQQNKSKLSKKDYEAGMRKLSGRQAMQSDPHAVTRVSSMMDENPEDAEMEAKAEFAAGRISEDDLADIQGEAQDRKLKPIDGPERARVRIRDGLKVPSYLSTFAPDAAKGKAEAVKMFDQWMENNPEATEEDIEKRAEKIIGHYRVDAAKVLPAPYGSAVSKEKIDTVVIGQSYQKIKADYQDGKISKGEAKKQADALKAWKEHLKE